MSPQHTQTPFEVMDEGEHFELLADGRARTVGIIYSKEDAAFIVQCCNNYEAMIELLRQIHSDGGTNAEAIKKAFDRAGEVL